MCSIYNKTLRIITSKSGFLKDYRSRLASLEYKIRELSILSEKRKIELQRYMKQDVCEDKLQELYHLKERSNTILEIYSMSLEIDVELETLAVNVLKENGINTVEDLFRFVAISDFNRLLVFRGMGPITVRRIRSVLYKKGFIDNKDESPLIDFFRK